MDISETGTQEVVEPGHGRGRWVGRIRRHPIRLLLPLVLLLLALASLIYVRQAATRDSAYGYELDRHERLAMSMATSAAAAGAGTPSAVTELKALVAQLVALPELPVPEQGLDVGGERQDALAAGHERLDKAWRRMNSALDRLIAADAAVGELRSDVASFQPLAGRLLVAADELVDAVVELQEPPHYVYLASRQMMLIQRMQTNLHRVLEGGSGVLVAADRIGRDAVLFGAVINGLLHDSPELGLLRVTDEDLRATLEDVGRQFREAAALIERIIGQADAVQRMHEAVRMVQGSGKAVASEVRDLRTLHHSFIDARIPSLLHVGVILALGVISLATATVALIRDARRATGGAQVRAEELDRLEAELESASHRAHEAEQGLRYLGRSVLQVMGGAPVPGGVEAGEIEGPAGEIVAALMEWREAFAQRTRIAAGEVAQAAAALRGELRRLEKLGADQHRQVREVANTVENVAQAAGRSPPELTELLEATRTLIDDGRSGSELLGETGGDVQRIKESIDECAQTTRRVVERSQQLREIAARIEELSDHSRMLSLNVALQAGAGEDRGRSITTYADELERLAERSRSLVPAVERLAESVCNEAEDTAKAVKRSLWVLGGAGERLRKAAATFEATVRFGRRIEAVLASLASANRQQGVQGLQAVRAMTEIVTSLNRSRASFESAASSAERMAASIERFEAGLQRAPINPEPVGAVVALEEASVADIPPHPLPKQAAKD